MYRNEKQTCKEKVVLYLKLAAFDVYFSLNSLSKIKKFFKKFNFSREGGGTLPENSYKPFRDLLEAILLRKTRSVQRLARFFGTDKKRLLLYIKG